MTLSANPRDKNATQIELISEGRASVDGSGTVVFDPTISRKSVTMLKRLLQERTNVEDPNQ